MKLPSIFCFQPNNLLYGIHLFSYYLSCIIHVHRRLDHSSSTNPRLKALSSFHILGGALACIQKEILLLKLQVPKLNNQQRRSSHVKFSKYNAFFQVFLQSGFQRRRFIIQMRPVAYREIFPICHRMKPLLFPFS